MMGAGNDHLRAARERDGECWGFTVSAHLGHGTFVDSPTPVTVTGMGFRPRPLLRPHKQLRADDGRHAPLLGRQFNGSLGKAATPTRRVRCRSRASRPR